jgi:hypothetical protein
LNELIQASLRFPTVVFTIGLGIVLVYWVFVLLGALDIDVLGGADGDPGADVHADGLFTKLGFGVVPITITISVLMLLGWVGTLLVMQHVHGTGIAVVVLLVALVVGLGLTRVLVRPLAPVFAVKEGKANRDYVGHTCAITTGRVDNGFGQATVLVIPVRCDRSDQLARGDQALIIDFDEARQAYVVEPITAIVRTGE